MDQETLIDLVRQYSHLYDKKHREFKNKQAKQNAWSTIASVMKCSREEVETAWASLRNRYVTERRKSRCTPTGSAATTEWRFFYQMSFLEQHVAVRKTLGNVEIGANIISNVQQSREFDIIETEELQDGENVGVEDTDSNSTQATSYLFQPPNSYLILNHQLCPLKYQAVLWQLLHLNTKKIYIR